ncbi:MAG: TonB-dependent receptor [bacterium]
MKIKTSICLLPGFLYLCLCLLPLPARAEKVCQLEPVIVSADRIPQSGSKSATSITLITQEELDEKRPGRVDEILRGSPGIAINSSGTTGETITIRLRGSNSNQTLVLFDGMKVNSPWDGAYGEWGNTDLADIGRIEILRGPQSELYGSEAMGGVVHLFTKAGKENRGAAFSVGGGSFGNLKESLEYGGGGEKVNYLLSATVQTNSQGQFDHDAYWNKGLTARVDWQAANSLSLKAICRYWEAKKELAVNPEGKISSTQYTYFRDEKGVRRDRFSQQVLSAEGDAGDFWHYKVTLGALHDHYRTEKGKYAKPAELSINDVSSDRLMAATQLDFFWPALPDILDNTLSTGLDYEQESVDSLALTETNGKPDSKKVIDKNRHQVSLFFQDRLEIHPFRDILTIIPTAGLRWDNNSVYGDVVSPRISASLSLDPTGTRFKGSWAQGFRAPTFKELYYPQYGNPKLEPERNDSYEAGVEQSIFNVLTIGCTGFFTKYKDLITRTPSGFYNISKATARGIEGEFMYNPFAVLGFQVSYTYLDTEDEVHHHEIPEMPRNTWKIAADYQQGGFSLQPVVQIVSSEYSLAYLDPPSSYYDLKGNLMQKHNAGYTRVDVTFQYRIPPRLTLASQWRLFTRINNLLNEKYYEVQGLPAPGINFLTGITGTF